MIANYFSAEAAIIARLQEISDLRAVVSAGDLAEVVEKSQTTPAVAVLYGGDNLSGAATAQAGRGQARIVRQRWITVVMVRHARDDGGKSARQEAGPLVSQVLGKLSGWQPSKAHGELIRAGAPAPLYRRGGLAYFPVLFETLISTVA